MKFENQVTYFELDKSYYCFILQNGRVKFKANKKPFRVIKTSKGWRFFAPGLSSRWQRNLSVTNMDKLGTYVFETEQEAIEAYDKLLIHFAEDATTERREQIYNQLINASRPSKSSLETKAIQWYKNLSDEEKEYVEFIKYKYSEV